MAKLPVISGDDLIKVLEKPLTKDLHQGGKDLFRG